MYSGDLLLGGRVHMGGILLETPSDDVHTSSIDEWLAYRHYLRHGFYPPDIPYDPSDSFVVVGEGREVQPRSFECFELESYTWVGSSTQLQIYRAVNNASPLSWVWVGGQRRLCAVWMTQAGALVSSVFDHAAMAWVDREERVDPCNVGFEMFSPTLTDQPGGGVIGWLERDAATEYGGDFSICESELAAGPVAPATLLYNVHIVATPIPSEPPGDAGLKFLASAAGAGGPVYVATQYDFNVTTDEAVDQYALSLVAGVRDDLWFSGQPVQVPTLGRASDPTVPTSPDGRYTIFVWEERVGTAAPGAVTLYYRVERSDGTVEGPFELLTADPWFSANSWVDRGDPSVAALDDVAYVAFHQLNPDPSGSVASIHVARMPMVDPLTAASEWEFPFTNPTGAIGPGWFAKISAERYRHLGADVIAVTCEGTEFDAAAVDKVAPIWILQAPLESGPFLFHEERFLPGTPDVVADLHRMQKACTVTVAPEGEGIDGLTPTVDVEWFDTQWIRRHGLEPEYTARLMHCTILVESLAPLPFVEL